MLECIGAELVRLRETGIYFNNMKAVELRVRDTAYKMAFDLIDSDADLVNDFSIFSKFVRQEMREFLPFLSGVDGSFRYDSNHFSIIEELSDKRGMQDIKNYATAFKYLCNSNDILEDFKAINANTRKAVSRFYPVYGMNAKRLLWRKCQAVFEDFMLNLGVEEGYAGYFFELPYMCHTAYIMATRRMSLKDAKEYIANLNEPMFINGVSKEFESKVIVDILSGKVSGIDGPESARLRTAEKSIRVGTMCDTTINNFYTEKIVPLSLKILNEMLRVIKTEAVENGLCENDDLKVYYVSPLRIGVMIRVGLKIEEVLKKSYKKLSIVDPVSSSSIIKNHICAYRFGVEE